MKVVDNNEKVSFVNNAVAAGFGYATYNQGKKIIGKNINKKIVKGITNVPQAQNDTFWKAANQAFQTSPLVNKKVQIVDLNPSNFESFKNETVNKMFGQKIKGNSWLDKKLQKLIDKSRIKLERGLKAVSEGSNACYIPATKKIAVNSKKMAFSTLHEIGHSINHASKGLAGALHKYRNKAALLAPVILLMSLFKKKKAEGEKPKNLWDKFTTFIKNNCGKLMFLTMVPTIAEEGLASLNAAKLGKKVLSADMLKKLNKLNFRAWTTYLSSGIIVGVCGWLAVKVKDRLLQPELTEKRPILY